MFDAFQSQGPDGVDRLILGSCLENAVVQDYLSDSLPMADIDSVLIGWEAFSGGLEKRRLDEAIQ